MLELDKFIRVKNNRLEVLVVGLAKEFSLHAQKEGYHLPITSTYRANWISNKIKENLNNSSINLVVLDCRMEVYTNYIAKNILEVLNLKPKQVLILTSNDPKNILEGYNYTIDRLGDINTFFFYSNLIKRQIDWENIEIDIPVISLAARPTEFRARLAKDLADLCKDKIRISFGNQLNRIVSAKEHELYTNILHPYPFPFIQNTDNKFLDYTEDMVQDHVGNNLFQSLLAIVNETNQYNEENIQLSEKSFKHFAWHQIPIFNASKGHVEVVRSLGFDMFDDIIDHSYDNAPNIHIQKLKILNIVSKFLKKYPTVKDVNNLRKSVFHRLQSNNRLLHKFNLERVYEPWPYYG